MIAPTYHVNKADGNLVEADLLLKQALVATAVGIDGGGYLSTDTDSLRKIVTEIAQAAEHIEVARMDLNMATRAAEGEQ